MPPASVVDGLRILALRAEPPQVAPGEETLLDALVVDPNDVAVSFAWVVCDPVAEGALSPCLEEREPRALARFLAAPPAGVTVVPFVETLRYRAPTGQAGVALVLLAAFEGTDPSALERDDAVMRFALKRVVVAGADENDNPSISGLFIADSSSPGGTVSLSARCSDDSAQSYTRVLPGGDRLDAREHLTLSWFTTGGRFVSSSDDVARTDDGEEIGLEVDGPAQVFVVARDGRGGVDWRSTRLDASP